MEIMITEINNFKNNCHNGDNNTNDVDIVININPISNHHQRLKDEGGK